MLPRLCFRDWTHYFDYNELSPVNIENELVSSALLNIYIL